VETTLVDGAALSLGPLATLGCLTVWATRDKNLYNPLNLLNLWIIFAARLA